MARKSIADINAQLGRIIDYYGDDGNTRSERAYEIAGRYADNIYRTRQARLDSQRNRTTDVMNNRKYSRKTYMGINAG